MSDCRPVIGVRVIFSGGGGGGGGGDGGHHVFSKPKSSSTSFLVGVHFRYIASFPPLEHGNSHE